MRRASVDGIMMVGRVCPLSWEKRVEGGEMLRTRFTDLVGCSVPLQLAGMGGGVGTPELAAAVARAGGLGMIGPGPSADELRVILDGLRDSPPGAIGVNFVMPFLEEVAAVEVAASRARVVEFFYGDPDAELVRIVHDGGALASWQVGSAAEARAAVEGGCDLVAAQGTEAGGHVRGRLGLLSLLPEVLDAVEVPVVVAGGVGSTRGVAAALAAGADGVRVGTRFVAAAESGAHPEYVAALVEASSEDTVVTETFSAEWPDAPHRVLSSCVEAAEALGTDVAGEVTYGGSTVPVRRFASLPPNRATRGEVGAMALYAGQSVGAVRGVQPAGEIVAKLMEGAEHLLRAWS
jgi:nitronate monooxygenase